MARCGATGRGIGSRLFRQSCLPQTVLHSGEVLGSSKGNPIPDVGGAQGRRELADMRHCCTRFRRASPQVHRLPPDLAAREEGSVACAMLVPPIEPPRRTCPLGNGRTYAALRPETEWVARAQAHRVGQLLDRRFWFAKEGLRPAAAVPRQGQVRIERQRRNRERPSRRRIVVDKGERISAAESSAGVQSEAPAGSPMCASSSRRRRICGSSLFQVGELASTSPAMR